MPKSGDKPKRARSAYIIFVSETRPKVIEENPDIAKAQKEIMRKIAELWRNMSDDEKAVYQEKAAAEKASVGGSSKKKSGKKGKKKNDDDDED